MIISLYISVWHSVYKMENSIRRNAFEFLDELIGNQKLVNFFGLVVIFVHYFQIFAAQFIPNIVGDRSKSWTESFIFFTTSVDNTFAGLYVIYIIYTFFFLIVSSFFWASVQKLKIKGIFWYIREIIRIFPGIIFIYPLIGHAAQIIYKFTITDVHWYDTMVVILDIIFYFLFILHEYYLTPVLAGSPLCGHSHMPSRILPEYGFSVFMQHDYLSFFILVATQNLFMKYAYCIIQITMCIRNVLFIGMNPFYASSLTNATIAMCFTTILINFGFIISLKLNAFRILIYVLIFEIIVFFISYFLTELIRNANMNKIKIAIETNDLSTLKKINPQKLLLIVLMKNVGNDEIFKFICKNAKGNFSVLMKIISKKFAPKTEGYLIDTGNFLFSFEIYRQLKKKI